MSMETNLHGRLRNTALPVNVALLPVFEAVVNSIHAIEDARLRSGKGRVTVEIIRDQQESLDLHSDDESEGFERPRDIVGFKIRDNGIGFNEENMTSFLTLDSEYKASKGGRGIGRLLWLKAFKRVSVESVFAVGKKELFVRTFHFNRSEGVCKNTVKKKSSGRISTTVHLEGFEQKYRDYARKSAKTIASNLLEHCLWNFIKDGGAPKISIKDGGKTVGLFSVYDKLMVSSATTDKIEIKGTNFELIHIRLRAHTNSYHKVAFCAANRVVKEESIRGKVAGLFGNLGDSNGQFIYACYVSSKLLDD